MKARRLKKLAELINSAGFPYHAVVSRGFCNTDRKIKGTRLRHPGKGREGNKIEVYVKDPISGYRLCYTHNAAETYRCNSEVEEWIKQHLPEKFWHEDFKRPKGKEQS